MVENFLYINDDADYSHLNDKEKYKNLHEKIGKDRANLEMHWRFKWLKYFNPQPNSIIIELGSCGGANLIPYSEIR